MKYIIPVLRNNTYCNEEIEFGIEDDDSLPSDDPHTVTLFLRSITDRTGLTRDDIDDWDCTRFASVKASDLLKALEWLHQWAGPKERKHVSYAVGDPYGIFSYVPHTVLSNGSVMLSQDAIEQLWRQTHGWEPLPDWRKQYAN